MTLIWQMDQKFCLLNLTSIKSASEKLRVYCNFIWLIIPETCPKISQIELASSPYPCFATLNRMFKFFLLPSQKQQCHILVLTPFTEHGWYWFSYGEIIGLVGIFQDIIMPVSIVNVPFHNILSYGHYLQQKITKCAKIKLISKWESWHIK